jgi:hypothetical protein
VGQFDCGGQAIVGGLVPDRASITLDTIRRIRKKTAKVAAEAARAGNLEHYDSAQADEDLKRTTANH